MEGPPAWALRALAVLLLVVMGTGVYWWNRDPGPSGVQLSDAAQRVAEVRWVEDAQVGGFDAPVNLPAVTAGPPGWDARIVYTGESCDDGVKVTVPGAGPVVVSSVSYARECDDMGVSHAVDMRWAQGRALDPLSVTQAPAREPRQDGRRH